MFGRKKKRQQQVLSESTALSDAKLGKPQFKVTEKNNVYWQFSWKVNIKNQGRQTLPIGSLTIRFVDRKGYVLHEELVEAFVGISKKSKHEFKGVSLIDKSLAKKVKGAEVVLRSI